VDSEEAVAMWDCQQLIGLTVAATDGEIGRLTDLCFDDERWVIRYFVVNTSSSEPQMLVALGLEQLADDLSCLHELQELTALARMPQRPAPPAWVAAATRPHETLGWSASPHPGIERGRDIGEPAADDTHLRRVEEVRGYRVVASDGEVGYVQGFLISEASWSIQYIVVEAPDSDRKVVLVPSWIRSIDRGCAEVRLDVARDVVLAGPEFTDDVQEAYEAWLFKHLGSMVVPTAH
jgi:hypothetical protein